MQASECQISRRPLCFNRLLTPDHNIFFIRKYYIPGGKQMGRLDGKVAIVTGSTSGMGRDTAYVFAEEGAKVIITGRNEQRAKETVDHIKKKGGEASYF